MPSKLKNLWLLGVSMAFYAWGAPNFILILLASTVLDFFLVKKQFNTEGTQKRQWLVASIVLNLGLLAYFKYANFFVDNINAIITASGGSEQLWLNVALPIGISFYVFQSITYAVDVYRGEAKPLDKLTDYLLYIMMFPQMIAGPIVRYQTVAEELKKRETGVDQFINGFIRFVTGLAKKVLIANVLAEYAEVVFSAKDLDVFSSTDVALGLLAYTFQIYFDFSGYSDMAIGLGRMFGFTFPENFNLPYIARNITDFWRRWHITLSQFMRDYLYIPLGGNKAGKTRLYINLITVFLLSGLWHGASWNFVLWGAIHGTFLILDRLFLKNLLNRLPAILSVLITFIVVALAWLCFKVEDTDRLWKLYGLLFEFNFEPTELVHINQLVTFLILAGVLSILPGFKFMKNANTVTLGESKQVKFQMLGMMVSLIFFILSFSSIVSSDFNPFIYYRF